MHLPHTLLQNFIRHPQAHAHKEHGKCWEISESKITYLKAISIFFFVFFFCCCGYSYTRSGLLTAKLPQKSMLKISTYISIKTQISID